jgi:integrase
VVRQEPGASRVLVTFLVTFWSSKPQPWFPGVQKVTKMPKLAEPKREVVYRNAQPKDKPYLIADGRGLYMEVNPDGSKLWDFVYRVGERRRKIAIKGGYPSVSVSKAREEVARLREMIARGEDPAELRKGVKAQSESQAQAEREEATRNATTFEKVARDWHKRSMDSLNPGYAALKLQQMVKNVFPYIGARPIAELRPPDILAPLRLVEERGARESAHRILGFCGEVFRYAVASGLIESDPTRDIRGALARPVEKHFAALTEPKEVAALLRAVDGYTGGMETRVALWLGILTFVRPGNLRTAQWSEFHNLEDPERAEWRIPGEKMKVRTARDFVVPLAPQVVALLDQLRPRTGNGIYLFPSPRPSKPPRPMSNNTVNAALRRMGYTSDEMTGHGVRAMARTICHEVLGFPPEVLEEQLAHGKSGPLRGAYDRTTHMPERRRLMREWANYLDGLRGGEI